MEKTSVFRYKDIIYSCFQPEESLSEHCLPHHALIYVYSGEINISDAGKEHIIHSGEYIFLKKDNKVRIYKHPFGTEPYKAISIRFDRKFLRDYFKTLDKNKMPKDVKRFDEAVIKMHKSPYLESLFTSLFPFTDRGIIPEEDFVEMKMQEAMHYLLRADEKFYPTLFDFNEPWKIDIMQFMEQNFMMDMSIEDYAFYTGRSLASFKRDFAEVCDLTPQKWLIKRRLKKADEMIKKGGKKINDIYLEVGFKNRSHFSVAYKKQYGHSPALS